MSRALAVCSWSLRPGSAEELVASVQRCGLGSVQLALNPLLSGGWDAERTAESLAAADIGIVSGMMETVGEDYSSIASIRETGGLRPDAHWTANLETAQACAGLASAMGLPLVTFHAGFIPEQDGPLRGTMLARLRDVADVFGEHGVMIGLETGQESAEELADVLSSLDHPQLGVNFDPANVILYGRDDPMGAFALLRPWISQVHLKDARGSGDPERWGTEVPLGEGEVPWDEFFAALISMPEPVAAVIEREAGEAREADVRQAATHARDGLGASAAG